VIEPGVSYNCVDLLKRFSRLLAVAVGFVIRIIKPEMDPVGRRIIESQEAFLAITIISN
jgi:hypothetical protein